MYISHFLREEELQQVCRRRKRMIKDLRLQRLVLYLTFRQK